MAVFSSSLRGRLVWLLLGWASVGLAYGAAGLLAPGLPTVTVLAPGALDRLVPFSPAGVWLYLSFFLLVPFAYLRARPARLPWLARAMQLSALICGAVFVLWPTTLAYPALPAEGLSAQALGWLIRLDTRRNCLPSLHAALTLLCVWALLDRRRRLRGLFVIAWGAAICHAVLQTRQHLAIDLAAGLLVALAAGLLAARLSPARRRYARTPVIDVQRMLRP